VTNGKSILLFGFYLEVGLGVPLTPAQGYIPDLYGVAGAGYVHRFDEVVSLDIGYVHRSLTGVDRCASPCKGDNVIETKVRVEF